MVIAAEQLRAGDIVEYGGARHLVAEIRRPCGAAWPIAIDHDGWAIALGSQLLRVERKPARAARSLTRTRRQQSAVRRCRAAVPSSGFW